MNRVNRVNPDEASQRAGEMPILPPGSGQGRGKSRLDGHRALGGKGVRYNALGTGAKGRPRIAKGPRKILKDNIFAISRCWLIFNQRCVTYLARLGLVT